MKISKKISGFVAGAVLLTVLAMGVPSVSAANQTSTANSLYQGSGLRMGRNFTSMREAIATYLGIDANTIMTERQAGKSMVQIAQAHGKSEQDLYRFVQEKRKAQIDQLVKDGKITPEQAAEHEKIAEERIRANLNRTELGSNGMGANRSGKQCRAGGKYGGAGKGMGQRNQLNQK